MTGKQGKEDWRTRDESGAVRTLQRAWHTDEHEAAILLCRCGRLRDDARLLLNFNVTIT